jgi:hypothetical protein
MTTPSSRIKPDESDDLDELEEGARQALADLRKREEERRLHPHQDVKYLISRRRFSEVNSFDADWEPRPGGGSLIDYCGCIVEVYPTPGAQHDERCWTFAFDGHGASRRCFPNFKAAMNAAFDALYEGWVLGAKRPSRRRRRYTQSPFERSRGE